MKATPLTRFADQSLAVTVALEEWDVRFSKIGQPAVLKLRVPMYSAAKTIHGGSFTGTPILSPTLMRLSRWFI